MFSPFRDANGNWGNGNGGGQVALRNDGGEPADFTVNGEPTHGRSSGLLTIGGLLVAVSRRTRRA